MALADQEMDKKTARGASIPFTRREAKLNRMHGRVVGGLKLILPTIALAMIVAVIAWPLLEEQTQASLGPSIGDRKFADNIQITDASYAGIGDADSPFSLTASHAVQEDPDQPLVTLTEPKGDIFWADDDWYAITAPNGQLNQETGTLELSGGVNAFQDKGYEFQTESMVIDIRGRSGYGVEPVVGQGPDIYLTGEGFRVYNMGERVEIMGKSKLIIRSVKSGS